jgi:hypothetical protein
MELHIVTHETHGRHFLANDESGGFRERSRIHEGIVMVMVVEPNGSVKGLEVRRCAYVDIRPFFLVHFDESAVRQGRLRAPKSARDGVSEGVRKRASLAAVSLV